MKRVSNIPSGLVIRLSPSRDACNGGEEPSTLVDMVGHR